MIKNPNAGKHSKGDLGRFRKAIRDGIAAHEKVDVKYILAIWEKICKQALDGCVESQRMVLKTVVERDTRPHHKDRQKENGNPVDRYDPEVLFKIAKIMERISAIPNKPEEG